jgi:hypothetical protein
MLDLVKIMQVAAKTRTLQELYLDSGHGTAEMHALIAEHLETTLRALRAQ